MNKIRMPLFRIVLSLVIMIPSFMIALGIFLVMFVKQYMEWMNETALMLLCLNGIGDFMLFCIVAFVAGTILLLTTVYQLDKEREEEQKNENE